METLEFDIEFLAQKLTENPSSPLFARLADLYLQREQTVEALKLCEEGIALYPEYYAGHIVLGKIHAALKEYSKARAAFEAARALSPFNHTIDQLIRSTPDQPDASVRTTDENYFAESESAHTDASADPETMPAAAADEPAPFEMPTAEEMGFSQHSEQPKSEPSEGEQYSPEQPSGAGEQAGGAFPSYDEYAAQHQHRAGERPSQSLDEYLKSAGVPSKTEEQPVSPSTEPEIPQTSDEPEIVFSSPEQAQLFAEMTGEMPSDEPAVPSGTDIDGLAERLQNVERIIPQENPAPVETSGTETEGTESFGTDMVTPTLAEIYASQGEYNAAIQAYEILMFSHPGKTAEFQQRVRELQQLQMEKDGLV